ncbi:hypothetical protein AX774_g7984 [Zancudomyces culisetae]|uniref:GRHL1/CP2 C-terminal domain-containing protein n=1 Tax=Zancudomyces culisetae TaxID=1213189 RepID=A0A1R1PCC1_ZANCU|nr:hypothetical protein AX774_g7984 [Zancudomyces culisetae]|eukprot:OMH78625.1 hypothetical protein AX774_g7984 [Zancudomyces culisetae]
MVSRVTRMVQVDFNYDLDGSFEFLLVEEFSGFPNPFNERQCSNLTSTAQSSSGLYLNSLEGDSSKNLTTITKEIVVSRNGKNRKNTIIDGFDPGYVPRKRTKNYELCLYVNFYGSDRYNAIYLEKLTVGCLLEKLRFYLTEDSQQQYIEVFRETTTGLRIFLDDKEVQRMEDEQGMSAELVYFNEQNIKAILLRY